MNKATFPFDVRCSAFGVRCLLHLPSLSVGRWTLGVERCLQSASAFGVRRSTFGVRCFLQ